MKTEEFIPGDDDCIAMTHQNRVCRPGGEPMILMKEEQARALVEQAARKQKEPEPTREMVILQLAHALIPVFVGATWILGALEGLADPLFTGVISGICALWGVVEWKWGKFRG